MNKLYKYLFILSGFIFVLALGLYFSGNVSLAGTPLILFFFTLALSMRGNKNLKGFSFTVLIFAAVSLSMFYPQSFIQLGDFQLKKLIVPLLQIIMFGMGTAMSFNDFYGVIKMPKGVLVGLICQFSIMPFLGFSLATIFNFPSEIAAGVVLIGSSPSGLASNVMAYLAKANVALSVTLTAVATIVSPLMTPLLMKYFAGAFVPIDFAAMMLSIMKMVILPVFLGLVFNHFFQGKAKWLDSAMPILSMTAIALIIMIITAAGRDSLLSIGILLILAAIIHNLLGYLLGY